MSFISHRTPLGEPRLSHVWRTENDGVRASVALNDFAEIIFRSAADARAVAAACTEAAERMDALAAEGPPGLALETGA